MSQTFNKNYWFWKYLLKCLAQNHKDILLGCCTDDWSLWPLLKSIVADKNHAAKLNVKNCLLLTGDQGSLSCQWKKKAPSSICWETGGMGSALNLPVFLYWLQTKLKAPRLHETCNLRAGKVNWIESHTFLFLSSFLVWLLHDLE